MFTLVFTLSSLTAYASSTDPFVSGPVTQAQALGRCLQKVDDCEYCQMIDELYKNETNITIRLLNEAAMKSSIHNSAGEESLNTYNAMLIGVLPYDQTIRYKLASMGLSKNWPRIGTDIEDGMKVYSATSDAEVADNKRQLQAVYDFVVNTVAGAPADASVEERIAYYCDTITNYLDYDNTYSTYKIGDIIDTRKSICIGYCELFYLLCLRDGIPCSLVGSQDHMYNAVIVNDTVKFIDVTFIDTAPTARDRLFLVSYNTILDAVHSIPDWYKIF